MTLIKMELIIIGATLAAMALVLAAVLDRLPS